MIIFSSLNIKYVLDLCNPTTCSVETGFENPAICLTPVCDTPGYYPSLGTCESKFIRLKYLFLTSSKFVHQNVQLALILQLVKLVKLEIIFLIKLASVKILLFFSKRIIIISKACPMHCASCKDSQNCQTCKSGYGLVNNLCILCPVGTYLTNGQLCKGIFSTIIFIQSVF